LRFSCRALPPPRTSSAAAERAILGILGLGMALVVDRARHRHLPDRSARRAARARAADGAGWTWLPFSIGTALLLSLVFGAINGWADCLCGGAVAVHNARKRLLLAGLGQAVLFQARRGAVEPRHGRL